MLLNSTVRWKEKSNQLPNEYLNISETDFVFRSINVGSLCVRKCSLNLVVSLNRALPAVSVWRPWSEGCSSSLNVVDARPFFLLFKTCSVSSLTPCIYTHLGSHKCIQKTYYPDNRTKLSPAKEKVHLDGELILINSSGQSSRIWTKYHIAIILLHYMFKIFPSILQTHRVPLDWINYCFN